jgi:hypothetical protein
MVFYQRIYPAIHQHIEGDLSWVGALIADETTILVTELGQEEESVTD